MVEIEAERISNKGGLLSATTTTTTTGKKSQTKSLGYPMSHKIKRLDNQHKLETDPIAILLERQLSPRSSLERVYETK